VVECLSADSGLELEALRVDGGACRNDFLMQFQADVLGVPVRQVANPRYASAVGGGLAAFAALGELPIGEIPERVKVASVYRPEPASRRLHDERFAEFMAFYERMKPIYRRLNAPKRRGA
jgi:sugar (pentulose or hexulose) kinase